MIHQGIPVLEGSAAESFVENATKNEIAAEERRMRSTPRILEVIAREKYPDPLAYKELSVYSDAPFEQIRTSFTWGTRGKHGDRPLRFKPLCRMSARNTYLSGLEACSSRSWLIEKEIKQTKY